jgi:hypothetical protein
MTAMPPTAEDWLKTPDAALAAALEIAKATSAHGDASTSAIALGIAAQVVQAAAPIAGAAVGGPWGAIIGAAVASLADTLGNQHAAALGPLTPGQQALIAQAITTAASLVKPVVKP